MERIPQHYTTCNFRNFSQSHHHFLSISAIFITLVQPLAEYVLKFCPDNLGETCTIAPVFLNGVHLFPDPVDRTAILVGMMAVTCVAIFVWPPMLLAEHAIFLGPACILVFFWDKGVNQLYLALPFSPFGLIEQGWFVSSMESFLIFSRTRRRALILTKVIFSVKSYCVCDLDQLIDNR